MNVEAGTLNTIDVVILAGGLGTRLEDVVGDQPKPIAEIRGRPFLDILIEDLAQQGLRRFILCVGHRREQIIAHYRSRIDAEYVFSEEPELLGTGGAVRNADGLARSNPYLVLNGDSFCAVDYGRFLAFHRQKGTGLSLVVAPARGRTDAGTIELAQDGRITRFREKESIENTAQTYISAGIYLVRKSLPLTWRFATPFSLEHEVFPRAAIDGKCYGFQVNSDVIDIGTPDRYLEAQKTPWTGKTK